jgi:hypothetical protein
MFKDLRLLANEFEAARSHFLQVGDCSVEGWGWFEKRVHSWQLANEFDAARSHFLQVKQCSHSAHVLVTSSFCAVGLGVEGGRVASVQAYLWGVGGECDAELLSAQPLPQQMRQGLCGQQLISLSGKGEGRVMTGHKVVRGCVRASLGGQRME